MAERPTLFIDRSLRKIVGRMLRDAGATVEFHDDHFAQITPDSIWIPDVSARAWVILTKDKNIRRLRGELEDVLMAQAMVFTLTSGNMNGVTMGQTFIKHLTKIESIVSSRQPPFIFAVGPDRFVQILPPTTEDE